MSDPIRKMIVDIVAEAAAEHAPQIMEKALTRLEVEVVEADDAIGQMVIVMARNWITLYGAEKAEEMIYALEDFIDGDDVDPGTFSAADLTQFTDALQSAEAADLRRGRKWARQIGRMLRKLTQHLPAVLAGAL